MAHRVIGAVEPLYLLAVAPLLLFPTFRPLWTAAALAGLAVLWLARTVIRREPWPVTPFNGALLLLCLAIPLAVWASALPELTLPKLTGIILGLAVFRAVAFAIHTRRGLEIALLVLALTGLAIWGVGLLGMRLAFLQPVVRWLPAALADLPGTPDEGVNPNQLAGALVLYLPLVLAHGAAYAREHRIIPASILALAAVAGVATLILTRSRAGWIGFGISVAVLAVAAILLECRRPLRVTVLAALVLVLACGVFVGAVFFSPSDVDNTGGSIADAEAGAALPQLSLDARAEIWSRAFYALQDFPFTGVGLGTFRRAINLLYPLFLVPQDIDIAHAHNIFLQVGVDLGLGGLIAYAALLIVATVIAWQVARGQRGFLRYTALGMIAALVGLHVYGLADALALGSKPGLAFWMVLGLIAALGNFPQGEGIPPNPLAADATPVAAPG